MPYEPDLYDTPMPPERRYAMHEKMLAACALRADIPWHVRTSEYAAFATPAPLLEKAYAPTVVLLFDGRWGVINTEGEVPTLMAAQDIAFNTVAARYVAWRLSRKDQ